ncbi:NAD-dependent protein deacylase [Aliicoccus persicus]|uniref:NAD-dependent protein deacetylase n=1 Tax=Aliicoccus persicus TaxID=930138 RepID=A0A662Z304_9STAP|nr:NAD-dependent protein deacylase [Aliicoccus persicus]SEV82927.1 NAD-dependent deacetylase [Aliicoccus persicus]
MDTQILKFKEQLENSKKIVFLTGAGISVASGIPDFRSMGGLFDEITKDGYSPEYLLSHQHLVDDKESFANFYQKRLLLANKKPNVAHTFIAELEQSGQSLGVVTQNIDGLHRDAGSNHVDELHGSLNDYYCIGCKAQYTKRRILDEKLKYCTKCNDVLRPDIVLYGEMLDELTVLSAVNKISSADMLIVIGSSLVVHPAASFIEYFNDDHLIIINKDKTPYDEQASIVFNTDVVEIIEKINELKES